MGVAIKNAVFWDMAACRSCANRRFGGTYRLHLQGRNLQARNQREQVAADCRLKSAECIYIPHTFTLFNMKLKTSKRG
jgi:hypothetical protein